jgi:hypothetical protein
MRWSRARVGQLAGVSHDARYPTGALIYSPYDNAVCGPDGFACPQGYLPTRDAAGRDTCLKKS